MQKENFSQGFGIVVIINCTETVIVMHNRSVASMVWQVCGPRPAPHLNEMLGISLA